MFTLITGGAGYLGGHLINAIKKESPEILVLDNFSSGKISRIPKEIEVVDGDIRDRRALDKLFSEFNIEKVVHFAALKSVSEGEKVPDLYDEVNVEGTMNLIEASNKKGIDKFIFISSAAVYGDAFSQSGVFDEKITPSPISIYGQTKLKGEVIVNNFQWDKQTWVTSLRLFNVAGQLNSNLQDTEMTNLIPIAKNCILNNSTIEVFGNDYETKDGTGVRDYISVLDVTRTIRNLLVKVESPPAILNVGSGKGHSVLEVINAVEQKLKMRALFSFSPRRKGDIAKIVANNELLKKFLQIEISCDLDNMI
ncbi:GalE UDP-glucose 4-epimerase [actinobacterium SCGC AAA044-D11]